MNARSFCAYEYTGCQRRVAWRSDDLNHTKHRVERVEGFIRCSFSITYLSAVYSTEGVDIAELERWPRGTKGDRSKIYWQGLDTVVKP